MRNCPNCQRRVDDNAMFCPECGLRFADAQQTTQNPDSGAQQNASPNSGVNLGTAYTPYGNPGYGAYVPFDPYDHTSEFEAKDVSENKVIAMLIYLAGVVGIFVALLSQSTSKYVAFHLRQALKIFVVETLTTLVMVVLAWTFIVPIAGAIFLVVLLVIKFICFFQICSGKAKEPFIIRSIGFLR